MIERLVAFLTVNDVTAGQTPEYDDLQPLSVGGTPEDVLDLCSKAFEAGGDRWTVNEIDYEQKKLHGTVETSLLGFVDDFYVWLDDKVQESGRETWAVVARSASRVGNGDLGQNARNIREFYDNLRELQSED